MKKLLLLSIMSLALLVTANAQQRKCGSADVYEHMIHNDANFAKQREIIEKQTEEYVANPSKKRVVVTIPVVFHIVYNTAAQNVSDAQIQSQLTVLNNDFRKLNADVSLVPSAFAGLAADCEVQFCLAQQDPNGVATTGIIRKSTTVTSFSTNNAVKYTAQGGSNIWDRNKYLNIWVCNLSGGVLGYAQFPGGLAATDGVVITYTGFGTTGTAAAPFNKGRTATHEVGHWLNLYHIWGDDGTGCTGSDNCADTPNQADENYGCPSFPQVSCSNGTNGDMFMNYMDYTDDACMYMFTTGQKARMQALFATGGTRVSLVTSTGCNPGSVITECGVPSSLVSSAITANSATVSWTAVAGATTYNVQYKTSAATTWNTVTVSTNTATLSGLSASTAYNYQVNAVCSVGTSAYSTASTFTTSAIATGCSNNYEANNTRSTASTIAVNTSISSMIGTSTDKDYYKIVTTSASPKLKVTLTGLPADYDLRLLKSNGSTIASSVNSGTTSETITYNTPTTGATYYLYVYGYSGAYSNTSCYTLTTTTSATNLKLDGSELVENNKTEINIYPNPVSNKLSFQYFAEGNQTIVSNIYNSLGQRVITQNEITVEGENNSSISVNNLPNGIYILEMIQDGERKVQRFIIEK